MTDRVVRAPYIFGKTIKISSECYILGGSFSRKSVWEGPLIERTSQLLDTIPNAVLFDVGANSGAFSLLSYFKSDLTTYSFEPYEDVADLLQKNANLNGLDSNIKIFRLALSDYSGKAILKCCYDGHSGMSTMGENFNINVAFVTKEISVEKLDTFVEQNKIDKLNLLKIDAEGCDLFVLKGGIETIKRFHPIIVVEAVKDRTDYFNYEPEAILEYLKDPLGYTEFEHFPTDVIALK